MKKNLVTVSRGGFLGLVGLLLVLVIISFLSYFMLNVYYKKQAPEQGKGISDLGESVTSTNYQSTLERTRKQVKDINKQILNREKQFENLDK